MFKLHFLVQVKKWLLLHDFIFNNIIFDNFILVEARSNLVKIRGLNDDVNKAFKSLAKLAKELDEANYVLEIPVFKQFHKLVVGKGGANIKKVLFNNFYLMLNILKSFFFFRLGKKLILELIYLVKVKIVTPSKSWVIKKRF